MKPNIPILTITLHIPLMEGVDAEHVLEAIGQQVTEALEQVRGEASDDGEESTLERDETITAETYEPYTETTKEDILAKLGYGPEA
jgi:hypothetical protein